MFSYPLIVLFAIEFVTLGFMPEDVQIQKCMYMLSAIIFTMSLLDLLAPFIEPAAAAASQPIVSSTPEPELSEQSPVSAETKLANVRRTEAKCFASATNS